ncbi:MAG TPA: PAS domain S-box protein [Gammaproteobacteria bacterium]
MEPDQAPRRGFDSGYTLAAGVLAAAAILAVAAYAAGWLPPSAVLIILIACLGGALYALLFLRRAGLRAATSRELAARLEQSERRYTRLVEQAINGFVVRSPEGQLLLVNEAYCRMTGYSREELLTLKARDMVVDQAVLQKVALLEPGESTRIETLMRCKGGGLREVEYVTQRLPDGNLQSVLLDVSARKQAEKARQESERRYAALVDQAADSIWLRTPEGRMLFVNDSACRMLGYAREELLASRSSVLIHASDHGTAARIDALRPLETLRLERVMRHKDGRAIPVEASVQRLADGSIQVISHDIGERKRIEQAREESERRYAELVDQALEGILVRSPQGRLLFVNGTLCRMLGYAREELVQLNMRDLVHPEDADTIVRVEQLESGGHLQLQKRMRRKDGQVIHVEVSARRLHDGNIQSAIQDVSERKESELRFRSMVEGAPNAMVMVDERGAIVLANPQAEKLFGYTAAELAGKPVEMLVPMRYRGDHAAQREGYSRAPQMRAMGQGRDLFGVHKQGHEVPVEIGLNPIVTAQGRFVLASIIDITERRAAEERERAYTEELRLMSRQLLEAQESERRTIARELHDEVGQSLTATRISLRDLEQDAAAGALAPRLADTSAIIADLLAKVRQMSLDLHPSVLDDLGLVPALRWCVRTRTGGSGLEVTWDLPEDLPRFDAMVELTLFRVFQEALSNILKHADAHQAQVALAHAEGRLVLSLRDDGRGFDVDAARRHALGGGSLGVLGMQERVRLAGGELAMESSPGQGTLIRVSLPDRGR